MTSSISASDGRQYTRAALTSGARRNIAVMALAALATLVVYVGLALFQLGSWSGAEWWLRDIINLRRMFYAEQLASFPPESRKTVIVGGSASLFGIDSERIEKATGEPTLNLGLHAGLDIDLLLSAANEFVDAGDRIVVPLEFELYNREKPTDLTPSNFLAFFYQYAAPLPLSHYPDLLIAVSPIRVLEGAWEKIVASVVGKRRRPLLDDAALMADWQAVRAEPGRSGYGPYDYSTMTAHGDKDLLLNTPPENLATLAALTTPVAWTLSPYGLRQIADWRRIFAEEDARMFLTWPIILEDDKGTILTETYWQRVIDLAREAAAHGQPIYCDPIGAIVPKQYRFDTVYHVNAKGAAVYSDDLAACIGSIETAAFDFAHANAADLAERARQRIAALKLPAEPLLFGYERNLRELAAIEAKLETIRAESGAYPAQLPPDAVTGGAKPWYRSDGTDYKLLIEDPDECYIVAPSWPERIDPVRGTEGRCSAYGSWTAGAAGW
jgi:hypothetical protein